MILNKISYTISRFLQRFTIQRIDYKGILINLFYLMIILFLGLNIFTTFNKGMEDVRKFQLEQVKLKELKDENARLNQELEKYGSIEYKRIYARENLNLAEKKETLYYIERDSGSKEIEKLPADTIQINLEDNFFWWKRLILGI